MPDKTHAEISAALLMIGEACVEAVKESGLLKPKRRIVRKRKARKAKPEPKAIAKKKRPEPKPAPRRREEAEEEEEEGDE